ncbi:MAG: glycosyltransferase [Algisphaera sp.]
MISVIIPAHNEAALLGDTLNHLLKDAAPGTLEIVVACNGCTDNTAKIARVFEPSVRVVETPVASKTQALNLGDATATVFPRFYLDADVRVTAIALQQTAQLFQTQGILAASPTLRIDTTGCSWAVKAFYRAWQRRPYFHHGHLGSGVYAASAEGRARFDLFPNLIADDEFFRLHFHETERANAANAFFEIRAPRRIWGVIKVKTRSRLGRLELKKRFPKLIPRNTQTKRPLPLTPHAPRPVMSALLDPLVFAFIQLATTWRAHQQAVQGIHVWERDHSTRVSPSTASLISSQHHSNIGDPST